jgi:hypothetical protein
MHQQSVVAIEPRHGTSSIVGIVAPGLTATRPADNDMTGADESFEHLVARARASSALGHWRDATAGYLQAIASETDADNHISVAGIVLELATITWDPGVSRLVQSAIEDAVDRTSDPVLLAQLRLCQAGGLHRSGEPDAVGAPQSHILDCLQTVRAGATPIEVAWATVRSRDALSGIIGPDESLDLGLSVEQINPGHDQVRRQNQRAIFADLLRLDRRAAAARIMREVRSSADDNERAVDRFGRITVQNCWNLMMGRFDAVQLGLLQALEFRGRLPDPTLAQVVLRQSFWLCRELGDPANTEAHLPRTSPSTTVSPARSPSN